MTIRTFILLLICIIGLLSKTVAKGKPKVAKDKAGKAIKKAIIDLD